MSCSPDFCELCRDSSAAPSRLAGRGHHLAPARQRAEGQRLRKPRPRPPEARAEALKRHRPVYFDETRRFVSTPVYDHYALPQGVEIKGPAIVEQAESTVVVGPRGTAHVDARGNLIMHIK